MVMNDLRDARMLGTCPGGRAGGSEADSPLLAQIGQRGAGRARNGQEKEVLFL